MKREMQRGVLFVICSVLVIITAIIYGQLSLLIFSSIVTLSKQLYVFNN